MVVIFKIFICFLFSILNITWLFKIYKTIAVCLIYNYNFFFFWNTSAINAGKPRLIWFCQDLYKVLTCITLGVKAQVKASGAQYFKDVCSCDNTA